MKKRLLSALLAVLMLTALCSLTACNIETPPASTPSGSATVTLNGDSISLSDDSLGTVTGSDLKITSGGTYTLTGKLNDGQILVEVDKETNVTLILKDAELHCEDSAPIFVKSCKNCYIELADGTTNKITDGENYVYENALETEPSAAIFSKADLFIQGTGSLTVEGNFNNAIASKDDLEVKNGNLTIKAANNGLKGKDSVTVKNGSITIDAVGDAIKSDEDADPAKGFVQIDGGTLKLKAGDEGIQGVTKVTINGGSTEITADSNGIKADISIDVVSGTVTITCASDGLDAPAVSGSATVNGSKVEY